MADRWMDERDRRWRERDRRGSDDMGRGHPRRYEGGEDRSFGGSVEDYESSFAARRSGPGRDRSQGSGNWQDRDYAGVSPAMWHGEYEAEGRAERYQQSHDLGRSGQGGRYYGDGGRERIYREEYGQGGVEYGDVPRGYDAERDRRADHRRGHFSEDYENSLFGAGDLSGGYRGQRRDQNRGDRWERGGREAGDLVRRAGERVASWFGGESERRGEGRDFRGMGPKGYKRADERINDEAHERLTDDAWLDATFISISVSAGEVTLSGTVDSREAKHRAERLIEDISGVNHVQNNLRVDRGSPLTRPASGYGDSVLDHQMRGETGSGERIPGSGLDAGSKDKNGSSGADAGKSR
jgi:osmotically-inducible protein OsmY